MFTPLGGRRGFREHHQPTLWHLTPGSPGALNKMIASSMRTELNGILAHFPDVAMVRIAYKSAHCRLTPCG
jgi:hypothetical protein